jgi:hypothetical protein
MGRKILFITTDQQRYDSLGCNGGQIARTPVVDALADHCRFPDCEHGQEPEPGDRGVIGALHLAFRAVAARVEVVSVQVLAGHRALAQRREL